MQSAIAVFLIFGLVCGAYGADCVVTGRVVDDGGRPLSDAEVYLGGLYMDDVDALVVINKPEEDGRFRLARTCSENPFYLFITSAIDRDNSFAPVEPPFTLQEGRRKDFPALAGLRMKEPKTDVGDIRVQTVYKLVRIDFRDARGAPLFPDFETAANALFTVRNEKGKYAGAGSPDARKKQIFADSALATSLPEGRWIVEVKPAKGKTLHPDKMVEISRTDPDSRVVTLRLAREKTF
ncbi:MAG: hypothetical protein JSS81_03315 [Acidobacteria bacterium]|nr:hypothetical protein [Acidobacteriota bacterium]